MSESKLIAVLGGTGNLGGGLAGRWLQAGYRVVIGSRNIEKAQQAAAELTEVLKTRGFFNINVEAADNRAAAAAASIVVLTVPFAHHESTLKDVRDVVQGKILVDVTVPLVPPKVARVQLSRALLDKLPRIFLAKALMLFLHFKT